MNFPIAISWENSADFFHFELLAPEICLEDFTCSIDEYNEYLTQDALKSQDDHIALTWLLQERTTGKIAAYMSLIADAISLSASEKDLHKLDYPFKTIPAMKIAKLAVDQSFMGKFKGLGSLMITTARTFARSCNTLHLAYRFLTVDADIEQNASVLKFYQKNGFLQNAELNNKNRKTVSMRKDIFSNF